MVTVAVPRGVYPDVVNLISRYLADDASPAGTNTAVDDGQEDASGSLESQVPHNGTWTRADIEELYRSFLDPDGRSVIRLVAHRSLNGEVAYDAELTARPRGATVDRRSLSTSSTTVSTLAPPASPTRGSREAGHGHN